MLPRLAPCHTNYRSLKNILQGPMKVEVLLWLTGDCLASIAVRRAIALCPGYKAWMLRRKNEYAVFDKQAVHGVEEVIDCGDIHDCHIGNGLGERPRTRERAQAIRIGGICHDELNAVRVSFLAAAGELDHAGRIIEREYIHPALRKVGSIVAVATRHVKHEIARLWVEQVSYARSNRLTVEGV